MGGGTANDLNDKASVSTSSPDLIFTDFGAPPPPMEMSLVPPPHVRQNDPRIGLFELRTRLDRRPGSSPLASVVSASSASSSSSTPWLTSLAVITVSSVCYDSIIRLVTSSILGLGSLLHLLVLSAAALSLFGTIGIASSSRIGSLFYDAISLHDEDAHEEVPLPSADRRRRYDFMDRLHECLRGPKPTLLGLAVDVRSPTDAGGAPIDVDAWGDF